MFRGGYIGNFDDYSGAGAVYSSGLNLVYLPAVEKNAVGTSGCPLEQPESEYPIWTDD